MPSYCAQQCKLLSVEVILFHMRNQTTKQIALHAGNINDFTYYKQTPPHQQQQQNAFHTHFICTNTKKHCRLLPSSHTHTLGCSAILLRTHIRAYAKRQTRFSLHLGIFWGKHNNTHFQQCNGLHFLHFVHLL